MTDKATLGRPSSYTEELAVEICVRLVGGESLKRICDSEHMPSMHSVFRWLGDEKYSLFRENYARARAQQAEAIFDEMLDISDDSTNDYMKKMREDGSTEDVLNTEHIQRAKLRIDTRKWTLAKMLPKKYGERLELAGDKDAPLSVNIIRLADEE